MRDLVALLESKDVQTRAISSNRPGIIVYEDDLQIVAVPFRERDF
jgi:hypothetical protein